MPVEAGESPDVLFDLGLLFASGRGAALVDTRSGARVLVIQTRYHMEDLAGRLLDDEPEKWKLLHLLESTRHGALLDAPVAAGAVPGSMQAQSLSGIR